MRVTSNTPVNKNVHFRSIRRSRGSSVSIATGYGMDDGGVRVRVPMGSGILFSTSSRLALGPIQWVLGTVSPSVKLQGAEADHSPPTSAEVKKMLIYTSTLPYSFMA
jgi:hypothetical protein